MGYKYWIGLLVILVIIFVVRYRREGFATKREKATSIYNWWKSENSPKYQNYKNEVKNSDIIEYKAVKDLHKGGKLNVGEIEKVIS